jgi:hypothetical protein
MVELLDIILLFPVRFKRLLVHFLYIIFKRLNHPCRPAGVKEWTIDLMFYLLDIFGIAEIHQFVTKLFKWKIRRMNDEELALGKKVFGDAIDFKKVRIDDSAVIGIETIAVAYVSFNTINYSRKIKKEIFIHELVHIWQYQKFGSVYMSRAIKAQKSNEGYDYGGIENLYKVMLDNGKLMDFNFEQQADIVEDYYKLIKNPSGTHPMLYTVYRHFINEIV